MNEEISNLPREDKMYAAGITPFTCTMFSHAAMEKIVANVYRNDIFSEIRLGTIVNKLGLKFKRLRAPNAAPFAGMNIPGRQTSRVFSMPSNLDHNKGKWRQPGGIASRIDDWLRSLNHDRELLPFYLRGKRHGLKRRLNWANR